MAVATRAVRGDSGETFIHPSQDWAHRAVPVLWACMWLFLASRGWLATDHMTPARVEASAFGFWVLFALWIIVFALICARIAWTFLGVTKISVSSDELVVRHCIAGETISSSDPIALSAIRDVRIDERETRFKGQVWRRWALIVQLSGGSQRHVASFPSRLEADEFLRRCVQ